MTQWLRDYHEGDDMPTRKFLCLAVIAAMATSGSAFAASKDAPRNIARQTSKVATNHKGQQSSGHVHASPKMRAQHERATEQSKEPKTLQGIKVVGILRSQMHAVQLKRTAPNIQDSITSVSIGQLPDITITNSLARIPGVQIDRSAGEGTAVNVRGLPEVTSLINGEAFLTSDNIYSDQPNYETLPSALFAGVDVVKSPTASLLTSGISGTINLRTRKPWSMPFGWTVAGSLEGGRGQLAKKTRPNGNVLVSYNAGGRWGLLLGASYSDFVHSFAHQGFGSLGAIDGENSSSANTHFGYLSPNSWNGTAIPPQIMPLPNGGVDVDGNGKSDGAFENFERIFSNSNIVQPKRMGFNGAFQAAIGGAFTLNLSGFYTHEVNRSAEVGGNQIAVSQAAPSSLPLVDRDTGIVLHNPLNQIGEQKGNWNQHFFTGQKYTEVIGDWEPETYTSEVRGQSRNFDADLKFDDGGAFTGDLRWINASADRESNDAYVQTTTNNGDEYPNILKPGVAALPPGTFVNPASMGGNREFNPGGFPLHAFDAIYDWQGSNPTVTWPSGIEARLLDPATYAIKGIDGDASQAASAMNVFRFDGHYRFNDQFSIDFGARNSIRTASRDSFVMGARLYAGNGASDPDGCLARYTSDNHVMDGEGVAGGCEAGNSTGFFRANPFDIPVTQAPGIISSNLISFDGVGETPGFVGVDVDPRIMKDPWKFFQKVFLGAGAKPTKILNPASSWRVFLHTRTLYGQANFKGELAGHAFTGNAGVRVVRTNLNVTQNLTGAARPYGVPPTLGGHIYSSRHYMDILPAINVAIDVTPKLILRLAGSKNMMPLSLNQWGGGFSRGFQDQIINGHTLDIVTSASSSGNPNLNPWRSTNFGASLGYYINSASMVSLAAFRMRISSFIENSSVMDCDIPDSDGVVRRCVPLNEPVQGSGATLHGLESQYRQALTFLPGMLAHTGFDANITYSPSSTGKRDMAGRNLPFPDNSEYDGSLTLWYQGPKLQIHVSGTYRSKRAVSSNEEGINGFELYQAPTTYVNASVAYQVSPNLQVYAQGENLTDQRQKFYLVWKDEKDYTNISERYYMLGVRFHF